MDEAPLDSTCSTRCIHEALDLVLGARAERGDEAALHEARERFAAAVEHALARHQLRDEDGQPPSCYTIGQALDLLFGPQEGGRGAAALARGRRRGLEQAIALAANGSSSGRGALPRHRVAGERAPRKKG